MYGYIIKEGTAENTFIDIQGTEFAVLAVYCIYLYSVISLYDF